VAKKIGRGKEKKDPFQAFQEFLRYPPAAIAKKLRDYFPSGYDVPLDAVEKAAHLSLSRLEQALSDYRDPGASKIKRNKAKNLIVSVFLETGRIKSIWSHDCSISSR